MVSEALIELQDIFDACSREHEVYPEPTVKNRIIQLYKDSVEGMTAIIISLPTTKITEQDLRNIMNKARRSSEMVMKEVEHLHRRELRQAHFRLREVDRKQDQVLRALEEQQKIMISMQEETKALFLISSHQKVLQLVQQLLARFPSPDSMGIPTNAGTSATA